MTPPGNAHLLASRIPDVQLALSPDAGHAVPLEHPEESTALLLDFFARHAARTLAAPHPAGRIAEQVTRPFALPAGALRSAAYVLGRSMPNSRGRGLSRKRRPA